MDVGFKKAGFTTLWANDFDPAACETYELNSLGPIHEGSIIDLMPQLSKFKGADVVFGGPPCQGFSVAGKMDPHDPRSRLVFAFAEAVSIIKPRMFVMENVKALGVNPRWAQVREELIRHLRASGYTCDFFVLNSSEYGVPQKRERFFLVGVRNQIKAPISPNLLIHSYKKRGLSVRQALKHLDAAGTGNNTRICNAEITLAANPIMRKSPYAGMMFNGAGRPINLDGFSQTLPASMGGNKTPIIDSSLLEDPNAPNWVVEYHRHLSSGGKPFGWKDVPSHLRRITVDEALAIQSFPHDFKLGGKGKSAWYRLIGNAVPCNMAFAMACMVKDILLESALAHDESIHFSTGALPLAWAS